MIQKRLKFEADLVPPILSGEKTTTWRINDDKNLRAGDVLSLVRRDTRRRFATARIASVSIRTFSTLRLEDLKGHEEFEDKTAMLRTYSGYYGMDVTADTKVKIVKFRLLNPRLPSTLKPPTGPR